MRLMEEIAPWYKCGVCVCLVVDWWPVQGVVLPPTQWPLEPPPNPDQDCVG